MRDRIPYYDTIYSSFEMVASGTTTAQHLHGWIPGDPRQTEAEAESIIRAYEDIGMRVSYCYALREQNHLVYEANEQFLARVPADVRPLLAKYFAGFQMPARETIALFDHLRAKHKDKERVRIQLAPSNQQWCTDEGLAMLADSAEKHGVPIHMHLVETPYQKQYARSRGDGGTAVDFIERFGLLGPKTTLGHAVWLSESDLDKLAATHTSVCHNCSSNFRLRSGVLPLNRLEARGINTTHYAAEIGTIEIGKAADMVLIDWKQISYPYLDSEVPVLDAVIQRAKMEGVRTVIVAGEIVYQDGKFTRLDRDAALAQLADILKRPLTDEEMERRRLAKAVFPYVKSFYDGYYNPDTSEPYYRQNSRT